MESLEAKILIDTYSKDKGKSSPQANILIDTYNKGKGAPQAVESVFRFLDFIEHV